MGMAFLHPEVARNNQCQPVNWPSDEASGQVAISVSAECLYRLLQSRQLHVEDVTCLDANARADIRQMLLDLAC